MKARALCLAIAAMVLAPRAVAAATPETLIDQLAQVDCNGPGLYEFMPFEDFWAVIPEPYPQAHLEGSKPDCVPEAMRALVRLGPQALPALVRHIDDRRPTGLRIGVTLKPGETYMGGQIFAQEYESRAHVYKADTLPPFQDACPHDDCFAARDFEKPYTIKVGDICFTLIGQIVNRGLVAAHYQMTGWTLVNSPIETPALARSVRRDWAGVDADGLRDSLLADLRTPLRGPPPGYKSRLNDPLPYEESEALTLHTLYAGALRRLRFYFPQTYKALAGNDLAKRQAFEKEEEARRAEVMQPRDPERLIGLFLNIGCPFPGASDVAASPAFLVQEDSMEHFSKTQFEDIKGLHVSVSCDTTPILNAMHFGLAVLPALLRHVDDKRPTKLVLGQGRGPQERVFADEYDARHRSSQSTQCAADARCEPEKPFDKPYTVKVGDICFVLIGQIVNRQLNAARYAPPRKFVVNSPVESPALADLVRVDWTGIDDDGLKDSLLADLRGAGPNGDGALRRLRYYFPATYAALAGADLEKRKAFETAERAQ